MGIFDSLHIGYSGLSTSQAGINTTSHNISNANTEGYSRQRISQKVNYPISNIPGDVGAGTRVESISRAHDEFVYGRLKSSSSNLSYSQKMESTMKEITTYTQDLDNLSIAKDIKDFFNGWSNIAKNPNDESQKVVLLKSMNSMTQNLNDTSNQLKELQGRLNKEFTSGIDKVNSIASEIVNLNKNINKVESSNSAAANANDLRDKRDSLELELAKMLNIEVSKGKVQTEFGATAKRTDAGVDYNINVGGFNIVDGSSFHPLRAEDGVNDTMLNSVYFIDHNQKKTDMTGEIRGGELGAILDLRGDKLDKSGRAVNSKIQTYVDNLDTFSKGFIQSINNIYASSAQKSIVTEELNIGEAGNITDIDGVEEGSFNIKVYDVDGKEVTSRKINISSHTSLSSKDVNNIPLASSLVGQINNKNVDDNGDNDSSNDLDDFFTASITSDGKLQIIANADAQGKYTIAIEDEGTNFAGATSINRLFDGDKASNVKVSRFVQDNPSQIIASKAPVDGNSDLANEIVNLQYENVNFSKPNGNKDSQTIEEFYRYSSSKIAADAHQSSINKDASETLNNTVVNEFKAVSAVDMDEELVNLMQYQTAYQANAKVITTIDKMIDTLLSIKQ